MNVKDKSAIDATVCNRLPFWDGQTDEQAKVQSMRPCVIDCRFEKLTIEDFVFEVRNLFLDDGGCTIVNQFPKPFKDCHQAAN